MAELPVDVPEVPVDLPPQMKVLQDLLREIHDMDKKLDSDEVSNSIDQNVSEDEDGCSTNPSKLKQQMSACKKELNQTKQEITQVKKALSMLMDIRNSFLSELDSKAKAEESNAGYEKKLAELLLETAETMPLYIGEDEDPPPALCGAIQVNADYISQVGDEVAAFVKVKGKEEEEWILSKVNNYTEGKDEYQVSDIDKESSIYAVTRSNVIPLPAQRAHPRFNQEAIYEKDSLILALYPKTTCFYKAVVHQPPIKPEDPYLVCFADSTYPSGFSRPDPVHQRYVLAYKSTKELEEEGEYADGWATESESGGDSASKSGSVNESGPGSESESKDEDETEDESGDKTEDAVGKTKRRDGRVDSDSDVKVSDENEKKIVHESKVQSVEENEDLDEMEI